MGAREQAIQAIQDGADAARAGRPVTACPFGREDILRTAWIRGYAKAAPMPTE